MDPFEPETPMDTREFIQQHTVEQLTHTIGLSPTVGLFALQTAQTSLLSMSHSLQHSSCTFARVCHSQLLCCPLQTLWKADYGAAYLTTTSHKIPSQP
jgi:hypothetical protein